jgi:hypothetical protein
MLSWLVDCVEVLKTVNIEDFLFRNCDANQDAMMEQALVKTIMALYSDYKVLGDACLTEERVEEMFSMFFNNPNLLVLIFLSVVYHMGESPEEQIELESAIKTLNEEIHSLENDPKKAEDDEKVNFSHYILVGREKTS